MSSIEWVRLLEKALPVSAEGLLAVVQAVSYCGGSQGVCGSGN